MKNSLKKSKEFKKVYESKNSFATKNLVLFILKNSVMERNRYGISVSHKVGNSVVRHTLIRRMREICRKNDERIKKGIDIVIVLRIGSEKTEFLKLKEEFLHLCKKHGILEKED